MHYKLGDLTIDTSRKLVFRASERLNVNGLSFKFLLFLLTKNTDVVSFDELIAGVWAPVIVNEDTVTQRALLLRKALGDDARNPRYIRSVRSQGYQLVTPPVALKSLTTGNLFKYLCQPSRMVLSISALVLLVFISFGRDVFDRPPPPSLSAVNVSSTRLSTINPNLVKSDVEKFIERAGYYAKIGQQDDNDRAIELYKKVLQIEPENAEAKIGLSRSYSANVCRYNTGNHFAQQAENLAKDVIKDIPESFQAHSALAYSYDCRGQIQAAKTAYRRAIELDPNGDVKSLSALAYLQGETGHLADAVELNLNVLQTDPAQTFSLIQLGRAYELMGLDHLAEPLYASSFELYPDNIFSNLSYPSYLFHRGQFSAAREVLAVAKSRPMHPSLLVLSAELALIENDEAFAKRELSSAVAMRPTASYYELLGKIHLPEQASLNWARNKLTTFDKLARPHHSIDWIYRAHVYQAAGEYEKGIDALLMSVESGYRDRNYLKLSPFFRGLREHAGFERVLTSITLYIDQELESFYAKPLVEESVAQR